MKNLALTAAAILVATTSAFAGSDHFNADTANQPLAAVDSNATASIPYKARQNKVDTTVTTGPSQAASQTDAGEFVGPPVPGN
ncbi:MULTISPECIES: DUF680 domain-containing protein [Mesorhizobium]|uniref:Uncharacterized protein n=1 Tax=Rhizobium loti TaxID=381 RepID=A0A6M7TZI3_RHILI|nr:MULTISPECIES: DUF680 domain-containing protein [Mesorhizobium]KRB23462.1 hypothetical protein ASE05_12700 [Mesorhizobium sp. Root172]OBQ66805.1 hypothetical protein A8145_30875 [Mesorhizobium loti]QKC70579.1 DUF680 domain-containing protein [Mesorhizobium loti]